MSQLASSSGIMATDWIELKVVLEDGEMLCFRQRPYSGLKRLMNLSCDKFGFPRYFLRFGYDGRRIIDDDTPKELEMEQGDVIGAYMPQCDTDLIIEVAGNPFPGPRPRYSGGDLNGNMWVHKAVLAYKSPVFLTMFQDDPDMKGLNITDLSPTTVRLMLDHIYNVKLGDDDLASAELLRAAAKYELVELKTACEDVLANNISMENCAEMMLVANKINSSRLRDACIQFSILNMNRISGKSSQHCSSSTLMLLQSFARQRPRRSRGKVSTVISTGKDHVDETTGSAGQQPVDDGTYSGDRVLMEMEDADTKEGAQGTLDDDEEEAGDNGHEGELDTDQESAEENEDSDDEASDRNERLLIQVCWVTFNLNAFMLMRRFS